MSLGLSLAALGIEVPYSARPVMVGDSLVFNAQPKKLEDLIECTIRWTQNLESRSEKYMVFKATNTTAGDTKPLVPVFVQTSKYESILSQREGNHVTFTITKDWQYGQSSKTGVDRFVVYQDLNHKPYQHRFVANILATVENLVHDGLCADGLASIADKVESITETLFGEYLHTFNDAVVQSGDILLVPSESKTYSFGNLKTLSWWQFSGHYTNEQYYNFMVPNQSQRGQDILFFIQKDWWDMDKATPDNPMHISNRATKNLQGQYEFQVDAKSQYGQTDKSGKHRWVVYHDEKRDPGQVIFIKSLLSVIRIGLPNTHLQTGVVAGIFGLDFGHEVEWIISKIEGIFTDHLQTFS